MSVVWVIGVVVLVVIAAFAVIVLRRRSVMQARATAAAAGAASAAPDDPPMTGLESALAQITDREGRPIREHIDAETQHVDDLRVPDDTGPLLRRALDHVEQHDVGHDVVEPPDAPADPAAETAPRDAD